MVTKKYFRGNIGFTTNRLDGFATALGNTLVAAFENRMKKISYQA